MNLMANEGRKELGLRTRHVLADCSGTGTKETPQNLEGADEEGLVAVTASR